MKKSRWITGGILFVAILTICLFSISADVLAAEPGERPQYTVYSVEEVADIVRDRAVTREGNFTVTYLSDVQPAEMDLGAVFQQIEDLLFAHTGVGSQGDYLRWHGLAYNCSAQYGTVDAQTGLYVYVFDYGDFSAYTTAEQEAQVDAKIAELFEQWQIYDKPDYHKVKIIYDYICSHVTYDYENMYNQERKLQYTAYSALIEGKAVCLGYANLFYRMVNDAGVDTRIVAGLSDIDRHAWNLVHLDDAYYWLDSTWDAGAYTENYWWFLNGELNFYNHTPDEDWSAYPISQADYAHPAVTDIQIKTLPSQLTYTQGDPLCTDGLVLQLTYSDGFVRTVTGGWSTSGFDSGVTGTQTVTVHFDGGTVSYDVTVNAGPENWYYHGSWGNLTWTLTQDGLLTLSGQGPIRDVDFGQNTPLWRNYAGQITSLVIDDGVTKIGRSAFFNLYKLKSVIMADSVTEIDYGAFQACFELADVQLSNGLVDIESFAFARCESLTKIVLPDSLLSIQTMAFDKCTALADIQVGKNVSYIGGSGCFGGTAFCDDPANWHNGALYLGDYLLVARADQSTDAFEIREGTVLIAEAAFTGLTHMKTLSLPASVKHINTGAFINCTELQQVSYGGSSADWRGMQIGLSNDPLLMSEIVLGKTEYDFIITMDETLPLQGLKEDAQKFSVSDETIAQLTSEYIENTGFQQVLKPLCPGVVRVYVLNYQEYNYIRVYFYTVLIQEDEHKLEYVSTERAPSCTLPGLEKHVCIYCGHEELIETELAEHELVWDPAVPATCEKDGLTHGFHCSVCQYVSTAQQVVPATGHKEVTDEAVAPNCTETGLTEGKHCSVCDKILIAQEEVAALGHDYEAVVTEPTFTEAGYTTYTCTVCGSSYVGDHTDPLLYLKGDLDGNEVTNTDDAIYLLYHAFFGEELYPVNQPCDFDANGSVNTDDAIYLLYHAFFGEELYPLH